MIGVVKLPLESNPIPVRDAERAQIKPRVRQSQRPQRLGQTTFECLSVSCEVRVSSGLLQRQGLWLQQTWEQTTRHEA